MKLIREINDEHTIKGKCDTMRYLKEGDNTPSDNDLKVYNDLKR